MHAVRFLRWSLLLVIWAISTGAVAQAQVTIPAGTRLMVGLNDELDTGENRDGDRFEGYLDAAVTVDGRTALDRGTEVLGRIREVEKAGRFRGKAELDLRLRTCASVTSWCPYSQRVW